MTVLFSLLLKAALVLIAIFMILLILVQRGRGGGLAGALGGPGGSSAFGTKAGDTFTRITSYTALIWMTICVIATVHFSRGSQSNSFAAVDKQRVRSTAPADGAGGMSAPAEATDDTTPPAGEGAAAPSGESSTGTAD
jgi:preprotein translocase subunit SecG